MEQAFWFLFAVVAYGGPPSTIVWGWTRWAKSLRQRSLSSFLSLLGLGFATVSALLAAGTVIRAIWAPFPFYDPTLLRIYRWGLVLALTGILFGIGGLWRRNPLRWLGPISATSMLIFWFFAASLE